MDLWRLDRKFARLPRREALADDALYDKLEEVACAVFFNVQGYLTRCLAHCEGAALLWVRVDEVVKCAPPMA